MVRPILTLLPTLLRFLCRLAVRHCLDDNRSAPIIWSRQKILQTLSPTRGKSTAPMNALCELSLDGRRLDSPLVARFDIVVRHHWSSMVR